MDSTEYERCRRVIDWMVTAHSTMRDRYMRRFRALTLLVMALSIFSLLLALDNGNEHFSIFGVQGRLQVFVALLAAIIFFASLISLVIDWPARSWRHDDAAGLLAELNMLFRRAVTNDQDIYLVDGVDLASEYRRVMAKLVPLPEKKVMALKALHNRKRAVFTRADEIPGAPIWWIRLIVLRDSVTGRSEVSKIDSASDDTQKSTAGT
jgi:hypothetical protein